MQYYLHHSATFSTTVLLHNLHILGKKLQIVVVFHIFSHYICINMQQPKQKN